MAAPAGEEVKRVCVGIDGARFRKPVEPGDQLILNATFVRAMRGIWKFSTSATVDGLSSSFTLVVQPWSVNVLQLDLGVAPGSLLGGGGGGGIDGGGSSAMMAAE